MQSLQAISHEIIKKEPFQNKEVKKHPLTPTFPKIEPAKSPFRHVFQTSEQMKTQFVKFLKTIFYQLDDKKVLKLMKELLEDPKKTDEQVYNELVNRIQETKKTFPMLSRLWSLHVLKKGMGKQAAEHLKVFNPKAFHDYLEVYDRRYFDSIKMKTGFSLDGKTVAVCNTKELSFSDRLQAGKLIYPYKRSLPLNDKECLDPLLEPEKTHKPLDNEMEKNSIDLMACLGGWHHIPKNRLNPFVQSLHEKLRPGGVLLMREHNVISQELHSIASVVHTFVNAAEGLKFEVEKREIREFKSGEEWKNFMKEHGFTQISEKMLVLDKDPTENAMMAFVKTPKTLEELRQAIHYRKDCTRPREGTRATWIEWGNVRFSKRYAEFIQNNHAYAFDYIGHIRQHWKHFYYFLKESLKDEKVSKLQALFNDGMLMNLFIVLATTLQCGINSVSSIPSRLWARVKYGTNWRQVTHLTALEKFEAQVEKQYSDDLDHTAFYLQSYVGKIKEMWKVIWHSKESLGVKLASIIPGITNTLGFLAKAAVSVPLALIYTQDSLKEPDAVKMLIKATANQIGQLEKNHKIEVIYESLDGYKLISVPRYRAFTKFFGDLQNFPELEVLEIGGQSEVSVDLLLDEKDENPHVADSRFIYEMESLQDPLKRRYVTYQVNVAALKKFQESEGKEKIHYIHE